MPARGNPSKLVFSLAFKASLEIVSEKAILCDLVLPNYLSL
jgi:hypothetical protein